MLDRIKYYRLPIVSGLILGTSHIPFPPWGIFFCFVPLWVFILKQTEWKKIFWGAWVTQVVGQLIGFHWVAYTVSQFGQLPVVVGILALFLFCALANLYFPISAVLSYFLQKKFNLSEHWYIALLPFTFLLAEWCYPTIFFWHLGYTWLWAKLPGYQLTDWIGFYGLNVITLVINGFMAYAYLHKEKRKPIFIGLTATALVIMSLHFLRPLPYGDVNETEQLSATIVQGNIGNLAKLQSGKGLSQAVSSAVNTFLRLSKAAMEKYPDTKVLIWPETAFPETIIHKKTNRYQVRKVFAFLKEHNVDLITGAYQTFAKNPKQPYNSMILLTKEGEFNPGYQKTHLLAFGEYLPGASIFPKLKDLLPMVSDFGRGDGAKPFPYLINLTNDSWFWYPFEPYQHMYVTLSRAIENRRPLIRATNTGISTVVDSQGRIFENSPHGEEWFGNYKVPFAKTPQKTFYRHLAPLWPYLFLAMILLIVVLGSREFSRKN